MLVNKNSGGLLWGLSKSINSGKFSNNLLSLFDDAILTKDDSRLISEKTKYPGTFGDTSVSFTSLPNGKIRVLINSLLWHEDYDANNNYDFKPFNPYSLVTDIELSFDTKTNLWEGQKLYQGDFYPKFFANSDNWEQSIYSDVPSNFNKSKNQYGGYNGFWREAIMPELQVTNQDLQIDRLYYQGGLDTNKIFNGFAIHYVDLKSPNKLEVSYDLRNAIDQVGIRNEHAWTKLESLIPLPNRLYHIVISSKSLNDSSGKWLGEDRKYYLTSQSYFDNANLTVEGEINFKLPGKAYDPSLSYCFIEDNYIAETRSGFVAPISVSTSPAGFDDWNNYFYAEDNELLIYDKSYGQQKVFVLDLPEDNELKAGSKLKNSYDFASVTSQEYRVFNIDGNVYIVSQTSYAYKSKNSKIKLDCYQVVFDKDQPRVEFLKTYQTTYGALGVTPELIKTLEKYAQDGSFYADTPTSQDGYMSLLLSYDSMPTSTRNSLSSAFSAYTKFHTTSGTDFLYGQGNDTYNINRTGLNIYETFNGGIDLVNASVSFLLPTNVENLTLVGSSGINGTGNELANIINGNASSNILDGGAGKDTMAGGAGDDTYIIDNAGDTVTEASGAGIDTVQSSISYTLGANLEGLILTSSAAINGTGNTADNTLMGNSSNNILDGGAGKDILTGLGGADTFRFSTKPNFGSSTADHITDFKGSEGDVLQINKVAFGLAANATVSLTTISSSADLTTALGSASTFVYDFSNGNLYWNQNGTKSGFGSGGIFAVLDNHAALSASNISLV